MNNNCLGCRHPNVVKLIDFGQQPLTNYYSKYITTDNHKHSLVFGICSFCGLSQLINPAPFQKLNNEDFKIIYKEPEIHLNDLVILLKNKLTNFSKEILGFSYIDFPLLNKLNGVGFQNFKVIFNDRFSLVQMQEIFDKKFVENWVKKFGKTDCLIIRDFLEHTYNPIKFLELCSELVKKGGLMVFEVPNSLQIFNKSTHFHIWHEHMLYFTKKTFTNFFKFHGYDIIANETYSVGFDDIFVTLINNDIRAISKKEYDKLNDFDYKYFEEKYDQIKLSIKNKINNLILKGNKIVFMGIGHLAINFINIYDLTKIISFAVDDDINKINCYLPGTEVVIKPVEFLKNYKDNYIMISTLSYESENKFLQKTYLNLKHHINYFNIRDFYKND